MNVFREVIYKLFHDSDFRQELQVNPHKTLKKRGYALSPDEYEAAMGLLESPDEAFHSLGPLPSEIGWFVPIELTPTEG
jgi:hypothetical protein